MFKGLQGRYDAEPRSDNVLKRGLRVQVGSRLKKEETIDRIKPTK